MKKAYIVVDLGYGDQGKGTTVDWLVRTHGAGIVVRFNGGAQAAHHVMTMDGRLHRFSQFGSGMFVDDVSTYLSKHMLIAPKAMLREAESMVEDLGMADPMARTMIDSEAPIISPYQQATNRIIELQRGRHAYGSCGMGIGETMQDLQENPQAVIRAGDLFYPNIVKQKLVMLRRLKWEKLDRMFAGKFFNPEAAAELSNCFTEGVDEYFMGLYQRVADRAHIVSRNIWKTMIEADDRPIVFEGAQGVLLDEWHGFHPHTTWSPRLSRTPTPC